MYQTTPVIPAAATGFLLTSVGIPWYYAICATFALIGAGLAILRILPVPKYKKNAVLGIKPNNKR